MSFPIKTTQQWANSQSDQWTFYDLYHPQVADITER